MYKQRNKKKRGRENKGMKVRKAETKKVGRKERRNKGKV